MTKLTLILKPPIRYDNRHQAPRLFRNHHVSQVTIVNIECLINYK
jgi:hypothetical protein